MYSYEIQQLMYYKEYLLLVEEYLQICDTSPQIARIKYEPFGDYFEMWTYDEFYWRFKVRRKELK